MEQERERICLTCGKTDVGNYCSHCGERLKPKRIGWSELLSDYWNDTLAFDTPFLGTIKHMLKRPGLFVRDYVKGTRAKFSKPMHFYLLILAVNYLVVVYLFDIDTVLAASQMEQGGITEEQMATMLSFFETLQGYTKILVFMQLPFLALFTWLFFLKAKQNYLENFVFVLYAGGIQLIINMIPSSFSSLLPYSVYSPISLLFSLASIGYLIWALAQFKQVNTAGGVFKGIAAYVCSILTYSGIMAATVYFLFEGEFPELVAM